LTAKQENRLAQISLIFQKHGLKTVLYGMSRPLLETIFAYLTDTPKTTLIGALLSEGDAVRIIDRTDRNDGDLLLAMRYNCADNRFGKLEDSLSKAGIEVTRGELRSASDDEILRFSALLYAEDLIFYRFIYHPDYKTTKLASLYKYVEENPVLASRIMEVAVERYSLDAELIKAVLETETPVLETGVL